MLRAFERAMARACLIPLILTLPLSACGSTGGQIEALPTPARVQPVLSPYSGVERCIGDIIDQAHPAPMIEALVNEVKDRTTQPFNLNLSDGGEAWGNAMLLHLAQKVRVPAVVGGSIHPVAPADQLILLSGAFTVYDRVIRSSAAAGKIRFGGFEVRLAGDTSYDLIAGDFTFRRAGSSHVEGGVSLVIAVSTRTGEGDVYLQDSESKRGVAGTWAVKSVQGIHQSQRAMVEFAVLAMMAQATGVTLENCATRAVPDLVANTNKAFHSMTVAQRNAAAQALLKKFGDYPLAIDGRWGAGSQVALNRFLLARRFPPSSTLAAEHYVMLVLADANALRR